MERTQLFLVESLFLPHENRLIFTTLYFVYSSDRINQTAKELSEATGRICIAAQADVREPQTLREAVTQTLKAFGRIDFVICGSLLSLYQQLLVVNPGYRRCW